MMKTARTVKAEKTAAKTPDVSKTCASVRHATADTSLESANLQARSELTGQIGTTVGSGGWTPAEAARHCGVAKPRMNVLLHGSVLRLSLDALVNIATALRRKLRVQPQAASRDRRVLTCLCDEARG
jgi:predicted XRE-type DNA-binding protein